MGEVSPRDLDAWISRLDDCKQLEESQVRALCNKVGNVLNLLKALWFCRIKNVAYNYEYWYPSQTPPR